MCVICVIIKAMDFLKEYKKLLLEMPKQAFTQWFCENSDYTVFVNHHKPYSREDYEARVKEIWAELKSGERAGNLMSVFEDEEFLGIGY